MVGRKPTTNNDNNYYQNLGYLVILKNKIYIGFLLNKDKFLIRFKFDQTTKASCQRSRK